MKPQRKIPISASIEALSPEEPYMLGAWLGAIHWGIGDADCVAAFRSDTGLNWVPANSPIERMIDEATGADGQFILAFVRWFNKTVWGEINGRAASGNESEGGENA